MINPSSKKSGTTVGHLFVISGPSGVGKGTLVAAVVGALPQVALSVSATTRAPREDDIEGVTYHFINNTEFDELVGVGGFLEWAEVHGNRYGTLTSEVRKALDAGKDLILEIDPQGKNQVAEQIPETFSIFIAPPSSVELERRLQGRATEDAASIKQRLRAAKLELDTKDSYNAVIVNDNLDKAIQELLTIIKEQIAPKG